MAETTAYLSPNGENETWGDGPATRLVVATIEGVATYAREDQGTPWRLADRTLTDRHLGALVFEPISGRLFAGAHDSGGVWVSEDGAGASWRELTNGLDRPHVYGLARRQIGDRVSLFVGTEPAALYRSEDFGETWIELESLRLVPDADKWTFPPPPHIAHVKSIVFHPGKAETIYALVEQGALLRSDDDGRSWTELAGYSLPDDLAYRDVHRLVIDPRNPQNFYLATGEGFYASTDEGESWEHLMLASGRIGYPDFVFLDPRDGKTLYLAGARHDPGHWFQTQNADSTIARSTDGGRKWVELTNTLPSPFKAAIEAICLHHWPGGMMFAMGSSAGEVYISEDDGTSWSRIAERIPPVSKNDHHFPWLSKQVVDEEMAARIAVAESMGIAVRMP